MSCEKYILGEDELREAIGRYLEDNLQVDVHMSDSGGFLTADVSLRLLKCGYSKTISSSMGVVRMPTANPDGA